jgi:hypothetical protein
VQSFWLATGLILPSLASTAPTFTAENNGARSVCWRNSWQFNRSGWLEFVSKLKSIGGTDFGSLSRAISDLEDHHRLGTHLSLRGGTMIGDSNTDRGITRIHSAVFSFPFFAYG